MSSNRIMVTGDKALDRKLKRLAKRVYPRVMRPAIRVGLTPIRAKIKSMANFGIDSIGILRASLSPKMSRKGASGRVWVDPSMNTEHQGRPRVPRFYAHLVEFGTRFMAAQPFMRPGFDSARPAAMNRIRSVVARMLAKEAAR